MTYSDISLEEAIKLALLRGAICFLKGGVYSYYFFSDETKVIAESPARRAVLVYSMAHKKAESENNFYFDRPRIRPIQELIEELKL